MWCRPAFAGAPSGDGSVWSVEYAFALALNANGICLDRRYSSLVVNSFKFWLTDNHYDSALSAYNALDKADWGSKVSGMDEFTRKVRLFLESSEGYGNCTSGGYLKLPVKPVDYMYQTDGTALLWNSKYADINEISNAQDYTYLFSQSYKSSSNNFVRSNVYAFKGEQIVGVFGGIPTLNYYKVDPSNELGYSPATLYSMGINCDNGYQLPVDLFSWSNFRSSVLSLFPFPIFPDLQSLSDYCKTGSLENAVSDTSVPFPIATANDNVAKLEMLTIPDTITLPASSASAQSAMSSFSSVGADGLPGTLASSGFPVEYELPYTLEYYKEGELVETKSGTVSSADPYIRASELKEFEYYLLDTSASSSFPFRVTVTDNLIQVFFEVDPDSAYPYTVKYYKDGQLFKTIPGAAPVSEGGIVESCEDLCPEYYLLDRRASSPLPFEVTKHKNTIHIYYKRDLYATFPYTVEYYKDGELFKTVPGSVSVFDPSVKSCLSYCPSGYVLDASSSTSLPYSVSKEGGVIKNYYVKRDTVVPYTVEYYKDGLRTNVVSGNVPLSSPVLQSYPSQCPEYYKLDAERSTPMPFTVPEGGGRIRAYYTKDENAVFPYTVECYKDGELVETVTKTVPVFSPSVKEYGFDCPEGYVVDTSSSTSLPYSVSKEGNVIKYYYVDEGKTLPYTVEYYKDGATAMTLTGNVPVTSPVVKQYWPYSPNGYILDETASDALPFTVTEDNNVIHAYYIPDPSDPYASFVSGVKTMMNSVVAFLKGAIWWLIFLVILVIFCDRNMVIFKRLTSHAWKKEPKQKKKLFTAPKSKFMKGVHANKGASLRSKANIQKGVRPGSLRSKANLANRKRLK